jgi:hypothetical protein
VRARAWQAFEPAGGQALEGDPRRPWLWRGVRREVTCSRRSKFGTQKTNHPNGELCYMKRGAVSPANHLAAASTTLVGLFLLTHILGSQFWPNRSPETQFMRSNPDCILPAFRTRPWAHQARAFPSRTKRRSALHKAITMLTFFPSSGGWGSGGPLLLSLLSTSVARRSWAKRLAISIKTQYGLDECWTELRKESCQSSH